MSTKEKYLFSIEVRDKDGKRIKGDNGFYYVDYSFSKSMSKDIAIKEMRFLHKTMKAWMPSNKITVSLRQFDTISFTFFLLSEIRENGEFVEFK